MRRGRRTLQIMNLQKFTNLIENLESALKRTSDLNKAGVNLLDYDEKFYLIINSLLKESFGQEGKDWIEWYLYEKPSILSGEPSKAFDKYGREICQNVESLWRTVISPDDK